MDLMKLERTPLVRSQR